MLVSFLTNGHKLRSEEEFPSYDRFSEKGSKTSKNPKINKVIQLAANLARIFKNSKNQPLVIRKIQNHKLNNNWSIIFAKNEINGFLHKCYL